MAKLSLPFIEVRQRDSSFYLTKIPARVLTEITYASIRHRDNEDGAIQRILNTSRISSISEFTINNGTFPNSIVLNWVHPEESITKDGSNLVIPVVSNAAQLIDGQHRVAGMKAAIEKDPTVGDLEIPVAIYERLGTKQCANIFLAINTEQKPVPRSLVIDLYGIADDQLVDPAALRSRDIVMAFNEEDASPYFELIKMPNSPRRKGGIALSTAANAIKPLVEEKGDFEQIGINALESQKQALLNFFSVLKSKYGNSWGESTNAFMYAAGFTGAVEFFRKKLIPYCLSKKSFSQETISSVLSISEGSLILQEEIKGVGGKDAPRVIFERLNTMFSPAHDDTGRIEF